MGGMTCGRARRLAWDDPDAIVVSVERARAMAHLARCPACQRFVAAMRLFKRAVGMARGVESAPATLRLRVQDTLQAAHRRRVRHHRRRWVLVGLAAALALLALGSRLLPGGPGDPVRQIVRDEEARRAQSGIESSDPGAVHAWLAERVPFPVHVPTLPDARLTGAMVAAAEGRYSAVLRFQVGGRPVSYVVSSSQSGGDFRFRPGQVGDLAVVSWRQPGLLHVWFGPIPPEHLASLARRCAEQARAAASMLDVPRTTTVRV
jgi:anti-sigma factor RsiW